MEMFLGVMLTVISLLVIYWVIWGEKKYKEQLK